ncbi:MAG: DUF3090 family protein [Acidimicrobiales bacterium]|nr:DUF3090 family protein [Acidimicrobiales bacterium]
MGDTYVFENPDKVTFGTIGRPSKRVFLMQVREDDQMLTVKLEKMQVSALSSYLGGIIAQAPRPAHLPDDLELEEPMIALFTVGALGAAYDEELDRVILVAEESEDYESLQMTLFDPTELRIADDNIGSALRVMATREQASALAIRGRALVEAGRPPCPLCGYPINPDGHDCPRTNGHRPPAI